MESIKRNKYRNNILLNYIFKIFTIGLGLYSTRITIGYLGNTLYGLWATIASIISWMSSGDFGIGNGLRNKYAQAYSANDQERQNQLIATGAVTLSKISLVIFFVVIGLTEILILLRIINNVVRLPMYITGLFFCVNMVLGISQSIVYARQKSWLVTANGFFITTLNVTAILLLELLGIQADLTIFAIIHGFCTTIPNIFIMVYLKITGCDLLKTCKKSNFSRELRVGIVNTGLAFFCLQICSIVLNSTDNVIINYLFDSDMVTKYSAITKVYETGQSLFSIVLIAFWSAVTFHAARDNYQWIISEVKRLLLLWGVYSVGVIVVSLVLNPIIHIWLGENAFYYEPELVALFCVYGITIAFTSIFVNIANGLQKLKLQLIISVIGAVSNIPLSFYFAKVCGMGVLGVKLATFLAAVLMAITVPVQILLLLYRKKQ